MPKIKGLSHVVLYVNDLDKMVEFYTDVLGLVKYRVNERRMVFRVGGDRGSIGTATGTRK